MIKFVAAFVCIVAVALAATGVQACGNPADALRADPVVTKDQAGAQQTNPKDRPTTLQGEK